MRMKPDSKGKRHWPPGRGQEEKMSPGKSAFVMLSIAAFFLVFAGLMTLLAPTYDLVLQRGASGVNARIERRLLWWIPIGRQTLERVTSAATVTQQPDRTDSPATDRDSNRQQVTPETNGYLVLHHAGGEARPMVSPENLESIKRDIADFLQGGPAELHLRLVANWKFGVLIPGILAVLGCLPLAGCVVEIGLRTLLKK